MSLTSATIALKFELGNCCHVVSSQFQVVDVMHGALLVKQWKTKHKPVAVSVVIDNLCLWKESWTLANQGMGLSTAICSSCMWAQAKVPVGLRCTRLVYQ